jgi:hypothetical protein
VRLQFLRDGRVAASVTSGTGGRYRIVLRPGRYAVRVAPQPKIGRGPEPSSVTVPRGRVAHVDFMLDTGIR